MPLFIATTQKGLGPYLAEEIKTLGGKVKSSNDRQVEFETNWKTCYRINLASTMASRILLRILDFTAYNADELYSHLQKHDFTKYIEPHQTMNVSAKTIYSNAFRDQRYLAQMTKDAVVDQFSEKYGKRPNVDNDFPDLTVVIRVTKTEVNVALDTSGPSLFQRGYRKKQVYASMKENLAAGLVVASNWKCATNLYDPMCGAGTILIEAARMAKQIAPGLERKFAFQNWKTYQADAFDEVYEELRQKRKQSDVRFFGYDIDGKAIEMARENAKLASVDDIITFKQMAVKDFVASEDKATIITNPPYGERLGDAKTLASFYKNLGETFYKCKNWDVWVLSGNKELPANMKLKAKHRVPVWNSDLECRFLHYPIY